MHARKHSRACAGTFAIACKNAHERARDISASARMRLSAKMLAGMRGKAFTLAEITIARGCSARSTTCMTARKNAREHAQEGLLACRRMFASARKTAGEIARQVPYSREQSRTQARMLASMRKNAPEHHGNTRKRAHENSRACARKLEGKKLAGMQGNAREHAYAGTSGTRECS